MLLTNNPEWLDNAQASQIEFMDPDSKRKMGNNASINGVGDRGSNCPKKLMLSISTILLIACPAAIIISIVCYVLTLNTPVRYSVVIDAGSTSSKLSLYSWTDYPFRTNGIIEVMDYEKVSPGISDYLVDPYGAYLNLKPVLNKLVSPLTEEQKSNTPVYLVATAGMRLKLLEDPLNALQLFEVLRRGLLTSGLHVEVPNERIRLLSGPEEGIYGWISVNNILGNIEAGRSTPPYDTVGSLDLGGASAQISFVTNVTPTTFRETFNFFPLKLYGNKFMVYSHSFLCYGKSQIENRVFGSFVSSGESPNPCFCKGYTTSSIPLEDIFDGQCMTGDYAKKVFGSDLSKPTTLSTLTYRGTGIPEECLKMINKQFNTVSCSYKYCSFNQVYQPPVEGKFVAYSGFTYAMDYFFPNQNVGLKLSEVERKVYNFCMTDWQDIQDITPPDEQPFVAKYCFDGLYIIALLKHYGFTTDQTWEDITFSSKINDKTISWALGYMLDESGNLPSESAKVYLTTSGFIFLLAIFGIILISATTILLIFKCNKRPRDIT